VADEMEHMPRALVQGVFQITGRSARPPIPAPRLDY
jgi:hypothetical protein